jgi:hypothetical protein
MLPSVLLSGLLEAVSDAFEVLLNVSLLNIATYSTFCSMIIRHTTPSHNVEVVIAQNGPFFMSTENLATFPKLAILNAAAVYVCKLAEKSLVSSSLMSTTEVANVKYDLLQNDPW